MDRSARYMSWNPKPSLFPTKGPDSLSFRGSGNQHLPSRSLPVKAKYNVQSPVKLGDSDAVQFYHSFEPYFEFTNFFPRDVRIFGKTWPTTEHFFQAQKFAGTPIEDKIRCCKSAREAFETARRRDYQPWIRRDWHSPSVKDRVMLLAVRSKFTQHKDLQDTLFKTGSKNIVEHTSNDSYWGDGGDGTGQNKLGKILVLVRDELDRDGSKRKNIKRTGSGRRERTGSLDRLSRQKHNNYDYAEQQKEPRPRSRSLTRDAKDKTSEQKCVKYSEQKYGTSNQTIKRTGSGRRERSGSLDRLSCQKHNNYVHAEQQKEPRPRSRSLTRDAEDKTSEQNCVEYSERKYGTSSQTTQTLDRNSTNLKLLYADVLKTQPVQRQFNGNRISGSHSSRSRELVSCEGQVSPSIQRRGNDSSGVWSCLHHS